MPLTGMASSAITQAGDLTPVKLPPPIGRQERLARLAKARALMQASDIGAIIVDQEPASTISRASNGGVRSG